MEYAKKNYIYIYIYMYSVCMYVFIFMNVFIFIMSEHFFSSFNEVCKIFVVVIIMINMIMTRCLRFSSRDLDGWIVLFQLYLNEFFLCNFVNPEFMH